MYIMFSITFKDHYIKAVSPIQSAKGQWWKCGIVVGQKKNPDNTYTSGVWINFIVDKPLQKGDLVSCENAWLEASEFNGKQQLTLRFAKDSPPVFKHSTPIAVQPMAERTFTEDDMPF